MPDGVPLLLQHLSGMFAVQVVAIGARSGALSALADGGGTAGEIAARAGLDERNTAQWLRAMTAAGHARHDDGAFALEPQTRAVLDGGLPVDMAAILEFVMALSAEPVRRIPDAMRTGAGVEGAVYAEVATAAGGINEPAYAGALVEEWIAGDPALRARLVPGAAIADIACGNGDAAVLMARAFPRSTVLGLDPGAPDRADTPNVTLLRQTADHLGAHGPFALVTCLDSLHHMGDPAAVARSVAAALDDDGVFLIAETAMTGDLDDDLADPFAVLTYAIDLVYCMQDNLASGGDGSVPSLGLEWVTSALADAGFGSVSAVDSPTGFRVFLARR
ncbi:class I SAM-dependent methyltransferase [Microbacterium sp. ASV49]|uniref:Methyltransferase domain-containing protein n=1 Tax=Microbacterium candidum TaxID=3041922 RepID=A0ABT7N1F6_9MICO|nr:methyltransferase domain-containing protein [Microbacterium sp. ASV49]MDL9980547.1 methyltransferase domain-containing protein [Microbacterium sp. ASV49]